MEISIKKALAVGGLVLLAGVAVGRYTLPAKIETKIEEKIVTKEVVKWKERKVMVKNSNKEVVTIEIKYPDGTVKKERRVIDKGMLTVDASKIGAKESETVETSKTEITQTNAKNDWHVSLLITPNHPSDNLAGGPVSYGASVQRRVLGPFYIGAYGATNKTYGGMLGVTF